MSESVRGIDDFLSPLPQAPVPLEVLEKVESESERIGGIDPLKKRHRGANTFISDFIITFDGTTYGLRFESDGWAVIATGDETEDVAAAMETEGQPVCDV